MPLHASTLIGQALPPIYFNPGHLPTHVKVKGGVIIKVRDHPDCCLWAIAYYQGHAYRYERAAYGEPWVRID